MIKFLERQLHVAIVVLIVIIVTPIMPGEERSEVDRGISSVVFNEVSVQYRHLDQLIQGGCFPDHKHRQQNGQYAFHDDKLRRCD